MIVTITLNPCVHKLIAFRSSSRVEKVVKPVSSFYQAGGKGINVARAAARLGAEVRAVTTHGGITGDLFAEAVARDGFAARLVRVAAPTRLSTGLFDEETASFTEYLEAGGPITEAEVSALWAAAQEAFEPASVIALCGSSPHALLDGFFARVIAGLGDRLTAVDTYGAPARAAASAAPTLFKSNREELAATFALDRSEAALFRFARERLDRGSRHVLVTGGKDGAVLFEDRRILSFQGPAVSEKNPVGSGDAMLGAILAALDQGRDIVEGCRIGAAAGAANAARLGVCDFERSEVEALAPEIRCRERSWPR